MAKIDQFLFFSEDSTEQVSNSFIVPNAGCAITLQTRHHYPMPIQKICYVFLLISDTSLLYKQLMSDCLTFWRLLVFHFYQVPFESVIFLTSGKLFIISLIILMLQFSNLEYVIIISNPLSETSYSIDNVIIVY